MNNLLSEKIREDLYYIGVNDRVTQLFEGMWPLPDGVAYNAYLLTGEVNICMDVVKDITIQSFLEKIYEILGDKELDYLVVNHVEPDHSSGIVELLSIYPHVKIICNKKTIPLLESYYGITENIIEVKDGEVLNLGGRELTFYMTPMVHWPESMVCYEAATGTLFSQDIFGGFGTLNGAIFDDEVKFDDYYLSETTRYFINIVGKYAGQALKALKRLGGLDIKMICPVHGVIWRKNPARIIDLYTKLSLQDVTDGVVIIYGSMYGNTERMAEAVAKGVAEGGISDIRIRDISKTSLSYLLADTWKYKGVILGSCSYNNNIFPPMSFLLEELRHQKMRNNVWGFFGSYSWSGGAMKRFNEFAEDMKYDVLEIKPEIQGSATDEQIAELKQLGREMAKRILADKENK